jgi:hypothetical protein
MTVTKHLQSQTRCELRVGEKDIFQSSGPIVSRTGIYLESTGNLEKSPVAVAGAVVASRWCCADSS